MKEYLNFIPHLAFSRTDRNATTRPSHNSLQEIRLHNITTGASCVTLRTWTRVPMSGLS